MEGSRIILHLFVAKFENGFIRTNKTRVAFLAKYMYPVTNGGGEVVAVHILT